MHKRERPPALISRQSPTPLLCDGSPVRDRRTQVLWQYQNFSLITEYSYFPHYLSDHPSWITSCPPNIIEAFKQPLSEGKIRNKAWLVSVSDCAFSNLRLSPDQSSFILGNLLSLSLVRAPVPPPPQPWLGEKQNAIADWDFCLPAINIILPTNN